ncbi:MAG: class I poly(R)-hydroxyalkanoic acid synthase, partial [Burkholderiales bacterium]
MNNNDPARLLKSFFDAGQDLMRQFSPASAAQSPVSEFQNSAVDLMANYQQFMVLQRGQVKQMADYWSELFAGRPAEDRRFSSEAWRALPGFDALKDTYLAYSDFLEQAVTSAPVDDKTKNHMRYAIGQYLDALSPSNFFATNPEALKLAQETEGRSLIDGMGLFLKDLAKGRISMTDESAFEVGRNVAVTEGAVVFENQLIQL